jgi:hypothetical protein
MLCMPLRRGKDPDRPAKINSTLAAATTAGQLHLLPLDFLVHISTLGDG